MKITVPESISLWSGGTVPGLPQLPADTVLVKADLSMMSAKYTRLHLGAYDDYGSNCEPLCGQAGWYEEISELFGGVFHGKAITHTVCDDCLKLAEATPQCPSGLEPG